jgi:dTDP-4-amino-4,6-dideoxygalactose transaminase
MIPHSRPFLGKEERAAVQRVMRSGQIAQGPEVEALEWELAQFLGMKGAVAVSSGTAGLHLALLALKVKPSDTIHLPSFVCTALLNAVRLVGAIPSICDVDPDTGNADPQDILRRTSESSGFVILPHMFGVPSKIQPLLDQGLKIIEDCAQSIGATIAGCKVGTFGLASVFSFFATKVLCSGEGGAVVSNSEDLLNYVRDLREYDNKDHYLPRYNYKMTDLQAALARVQLKKLPRFIERRREIARRYDEVISQLGLKKPLRAEGDICFRYLIFHPRPLELMEKLKAQGIMTALPVFKPLHRYLNLNGYPGTDKIYAQALSIPCYPALTDREIDLICKVLHTVLSNEFA